MCIWTIRKQGTNARFLLQYVRIILRPETFSLEHLKDNFEPVDSNAKQTERDSSGEEKTEGREKESALIFLFIFIVPCFFACTRTRRPINELDPFFLSFFFSSPRKTAKKKETWRYKENNRGGEKDLSITRSEKDFENERHCRIMLERSNATRHTLNMLRIARA